MHDNGLGEDYVLKKYLQLHRRSTAPVTKIGMAKQHRKRKKRIEIRLVLRTISRTRSIVAATTKGVEAAYMSYRSAARAAVAVQEMSIAQRMVRYSGTETRMPESVPSIHLSTTGPLDGP
jgi:hypothetical protein